MNKNNPNCNVGKLYSPLDLVFSIELQMQRITLTDSGNRCALRVAIVVRPGRYCWLVGIF